MIFEAEKCVRVHRHKTLEQLLVTIEEIVINLYIVALLDLVQIFNLVVLREEVLLSQLVVFALLIVPGVHDGEAHDRVHLLGQVIELGPVLKVVLQKRHALLQFLVLTLVDLVDALESIDGVLRLDDIWYALHLFLHLSAHDVGRVKLGQRLNLFIEEAGALVHHLLLYAALHL